MITIKTTQEQIGKCHCCEKPFISGKRHATDLCAYFTRDPVPTVEAGYLCKQCRERYFQLGAYTFPIYRE